MRVVALISGGKDSCFNMLQCVAEGHEIVALANLKPKDKDELDSYMYQTVGHHAIDLYAEAMGLPLYRHTIMGSSKETGRDYLPTPEDEVEDLYQLLKKIKDEIHIEAVSVGAILSDYQRVRVENVCQRLGLTSLAYLWRRNQTILLNEMIQSGISAVIIKVAAMGLDPDKHLGKTLSEMYPFLQIMESKYDVNVCGEGGEFETFTVDCPLFTKKIVLDEVEKVIHSNDAFAPVGYLNLKSAHLEDKNSDQQRSLQDRIKDLKMKRSSNLIEELFTDDEIKDLHLKSYHTNTQTSQCNNDISNLVDMTVRHNDRELWVDGLMVKYDVNSTIQQLTKLAMDKLKDALHNCGEGWNLNQLVLIHLSVQDMSNFAEINSVYKQYFGLNPPSRVCVQTCLPQNVALQIDCYGCLDKDRHVMHVQGLSHWAPANIGPYSQAVKIQNKISIAGQLPMIPANLKIIPGGIRAESRLSLRHVCRILSAMDKGCDITDVLLVICYVISPDDIVIAKEEWNKTLNQYKMEEFGIESSCSNIAFIEYVVIPRLPKDAKIEWQVYAKTKQQKCLVVDEIERFSQNNCLCCLRCKITSSDDDLDSSYIFTLSGNVVSSVNADQSTVDVRDAVNSFCICYCRMIERLKLLQSCLPLLRIFYPGSLYKYDQLYTDFREILKSSLDFPPNFALIPVLELSDPTTILYICH